MELPNSFWQELSNPSPKAKGGGTPLLTPLLTPLAEEHLEEQPQGRERFIPSEAEEQAQAAVHTNSSR